MEPVARFTTFNILHARRPGAEVDLPGLQSSLRRLGADVFALHEVDIGQERSHRADLIALARAATGLHGVFGETLRSDDGGRYGNALLGPRVENPEHLLLPKRRTDTEQRGAIVANVFVREVQWSVCATHLSLDRDESREQLQLLLETMQQRPQPRVVLGDLNRVDVDVVDLVQEQGWTVASTGPTVPSWNPEIRIDYVLTQGATVVRADATALDVSDHCAVVAELQPLPRDR